MHFVLFSFIRSFRPELDPAPQAHVFAKKEDSGAAGAPSSHPLVPSLSDFIASGMVVKRVAHQGEELLRG